MLKGYVQLHLFLTYFPSLCITVAVCVANNFTRNMRVMDVGFILNNPFKVFCEIFDIGIPLTLFFSTNLISI